MTPNEAGELLLLLQATWPRLAADDVAARLWVQDLTNCDRESAMAAFRGLRDSLDRAPSWATFKEAYVAVRLQHTPGRRAISEEEWTPPTVEQRERIHRLVSGLAAKLSTVPPRRHGEKVKES